MREWPLPGPDDQWLDMAMLTVLLPYSDKEIRKKVKEGTFPRPRIRGKKDMWHGADIAAWMHLQDRMYPADAPESGEQEENS